MHRSGELDTVYDYHDRTKHQFNRYARSLGYLDWACQPNPFRRYEGAPLVRFELPLDAPEPSYDSLFTSPPPPAPPTHENLGRLFYYSLALSAWKQVLRPDGAVHSRWSLRVDPSSGNLHPTEGYLIFGSKVYHYAPFEHALELRREIEPIPGLPEGAALIGITSIHWREAWKYGERAFRYCQHDCGHVIAAVALSAACLGWRVRLLDLVSTKQLGSLLGVDEQEGPEAEHPDCLLLLSPEPAGFDIDAASVTGADWLGTPNELSSAHHPWPVIDEVSDAAESLGFTREPLAGLAPIELPDRSLSAHRIIRQRRSAVAMDGETSIDSETFYRLVRRLMPQPVPYAALPWRPAISLLLFVHRVEGVQPGLYVLVRDPSHEESLRDNLSDEFAWETCSDELPLYLLQPADVTESARKVSCHQDIASDGVFAVAMLTRFDETLGSGGPAMYPRLFWETGVIGQMLYLEAEAAGIRGTGIGCFFDDAVHRAIGVEGHSWQSLYHFTLGGPVDDPRLQTVDAYEHLRVRELQGEDAWREA